MSPYRSVTDFGFEMELDCFEWSQLYLAEHDNSEPRTMKLIQEILRPGDNYLDVGAHVGFVSLVARQAIGTTGRVIAVEPQPYNCQLLLRNWEINEYTNLDLFVAVAGNEPGFISLPQQSATDKSRLSLALPMHDAIALTFQVPIRTAESIIQDARVKTIRLMKIDVEGFECEVLKGLRSCIERVDHIIFEALSGNEIEQQQRNQACEWLTTAGYQLRDVAGTKWNPGQEIIESNLWATREQG